MLAEPKRKPSNFWQNISRLTPFRKWGQPRVCAWTPSEKALYPPVLGGGAQVLPILCLQRMARVLLPSLFILQTNWPPGSEVRGRMCARTRVHLCLVPASQPCTALKRQTSRKRWEWSLICFIWKGFACQLYFESFHSAVNTAAVWQLLSLPALPPADMLRTTAQCCWHCMFCREEQNPSVLCSPPFTSRTRSSSTLLTNSVSLCWHSDETTVSIALWPFSSL